MGRNPIGCVYPSNAYLLQRCAPAGYGLGDRAVDLPADSDLDHIWKFGLYKVHDGVPVAHAPYTAGVVLVLPYDERYMIQVFFQQNTYDTQRVIRKCTAGAWGPWEWLDFPMYPNIEFRTTERWSGMPVYTTLLETGVLNEVRNVVGTPFAAHRVLRQCGYIDSYSLPYIDGALDSANSAWVNATVNDGKIELTFHIGASLIGKNAVVRLWYTKNEEVY